jgi:hypothetical protein
MTARSNAAPAKLQMFAAGRKVVPKRPAARPCAPAADRQQIPSPRHAIFSPWRRGGEAIWSAPRGRDGTRVPFAFGESNSAACIIAGLRAGCPNSVADATTASDIARISIIWKRFRWCERPRLIERQGPNPRLGSNSRPQRGIFRRRE